MDRDEQRFHRLVDKTASCWFWKGTRSQKGYGRFRHYLHSDKDYAHRYAYKKYIGEIPDGMLVLHSCHTPCCVNPEHLRVGTAEDNTQDMLNAGRNRGRGQKIGNIYAAHVGVGHTESFEDALAYCQRDSRHKEYNPRVHVKVSEGIWRCAFLQEEMKARGLI